FRTAAAAGAGDLLFASGNRFDLSPGTQAELALGARWKPPRADYSTRAGEYPGRLTLSGSLETDSSAWREPPRSRIEARVAAAASLSSPDTAGALRVAGMNEGRRSYPVSPTGLFLAPRSLDAGPGPDLSGDRGTLRFVDHLAVNALGDRSYLAYTADPPAVTAYDYAPGGRGGPYPASTPAGEKYAGTVAVFDYEITTAEGWVAGLIRVDGARGLDLSDARRIVVPYRVVDASPAAANLTFELGAIGEDLDEDGTLDAGADSLSFNENGFTLATGAPPPAGVTYTEDANGNGVLDPELPDLVVAHAVADDLTAAAGWQLAEIDLTAAEARRLADTRAMRVVIERAGDAVAGKIVVGAIDVFGSEFSVEASGSPPEVTTSVFPENAFSGDRLATAFPETDARLTGEDAEQRVLEVKWSGASPGDTITLSRQTSVPVSDYEELRVYYRSPGAEASGATVTVRASDGEGGFEAALAEPASVADGAWHELVLPLPQESDAVVRRIDIVVETNGVAGATVLFDELAFFGPRTRAGVIAEAELAWRPEAELAAGDTTLVSDIGLEQRITAQTASFPDDVDATRSGVESSTDVSATVLAARASVGLDLRASEAGTGLQGRHDVALAPRFVPVRLADSFRAGYGLLAPGTSHETTVEVGVGRIGSVAAGWLSDQREASGVDWSLSANVGLPAGGTTAAEGEEATDGDGPNDDRPSHRTTLDAAARFALGEVDEADTEVPPYPLAWSESFARVAPASSPLNRSASIDLDGTLSFDRAGIATAVGSSLQTDAGSDRHAVESYLELGVPWQIGERIDVGLTVRREARLEAGGSPGAAPSDDVAASAAMVADHPLVAAFVPFAELLADDYPDRVAGLREGLISARYRPSVTLEASRRITSSPWSLVVPTGVELSAARPAQRDLDAATSVYELSARSLFVAPNLFGRLGVRPLVSFYDSDEFQARARVELTGGDGAPWTSEIGVDQTTRLIWTDNRSVELETNATTVVPDDGSTQVTARLAHVRSLPTERFGGPPLPRVLTEADRRIEHETSLTIEYDQTPGDRIVARVEHRTSLRFDDTGEIRLHGGFGAGTQTFAGEPGTLLGVRAGIEGRLRL
ncbi:MAG: hypothetical protein ACOC7V_05905, partial [Spirochaetota bacterium]